MKNFKADLIFPKPEDLLPGIISQLGYPCEEVVDSRVLTQIYDSIRQCRVLREEKAICESTPFKRLTKKAILGKGICLETINWTRLTARMSDVRGLCCLAVTLGNGIDEKIKQLGKEAMLQALVLDAVASVLAEFYANQIHQQVTCYYQQYGLETSARFSPGYCDWPLQSGQRSLFTFLEPEAIGLNISSSGLMTPRKSVTAVMITALQMQAKSPCFLCARKCSYRRASYVDVEFRAELIL